jgi:hypothetical protein
MNNSFPFKTFEFSSTNYKHYLVLFTIWPFMALITAVINYRQKEAQKIVYMFLIYYGLTYIIGNEGYDAAEYLRRLQYNASLPFSEFFKIVGGLYSSDTSIDIIESFISFVVSRFTSRQNLLFASYAALFGFFYLRSINLLYNRYLERSGWNTMIFMAFFTIVLPITAINGFRMWTAALIFFYGAYHVILYRDKWYFILALSASLVHWSFLMADAILLIYFFAGNRNFIYFPLALMSFILPGVLTTFFDSISWRFTGAFQHRYSGYTGEEYLLQQQELWQNAHWWLPLSKDLIFYYLVFAMVIIFLTQRELMKLKSEKNLFSFLLLFLSFVNFGKAIPNFGDRFQIVFILFATLYVFFYFLKLPGNRINIITLVGLLPMALYAAVVFRQGSDSINAWILTPGLGLPLLTPGLSIADLLFN